MAAKKMIKNDLYLRALRGETAVSYTHLDVYKRQPLFKKNISLTEKRLWL